MRKKKDLIKLTADLNRLRQENPNKSYTRYELEALCRNKTGLSKIYFDQLCKDNVFPSQRIGKSVLYEFPTQPIYKLAVEKAFETIRSKARKPEEQKVQFLNEDNAIDLLKKLGYRIFKVEGIDIKKLQAEKPEIFEAYKLEKEI